MEYFEKMTLKKKFKQLYLKTIGQIDIQNSNFLEVHSSFFKTMSYAEVSGH